jgi:hypothetical protein
MRGAVWHVFRKYFLIGSQLAGCLLLIPPVAAQDYAAASVSRRVLTNEGVVELARAGFDELFIIERIRTSRSHFDASAQGLLSLTETGLSEEIINAIALQDLEERRSSGEAPPAEPAEPVKITVKKHWWSFRWSRVSQ